MTHERACALDSGWLLTVDYGTGATRLLPPAAAERWKASSRTPPVPRAPWTPSWSTHEVPLGWEPAPRVSGGTLAAAGLGVLVTLLVAHIGPRHRQMHRMITLIHRISVLAKRKAAYVHAEEMVHAVRHFGFLPVRMACLESSVATVVALALQGRSVTWHHGVRCDPIVLHAWVSLDGAPVAEPLSTLRCATLLTITSETDEEHG